MPTSVPPHGALAPPAAGPKRCGDLGAQRLASSAPTSCWLLAAQRPDLRQHATPVDLVGGWRWVGVRGWGSRTAAARYPHPPRGLHVCIRLAVVAAGRGATRLHPARPTTQPRRVRRPTGRDPAA